MDTNNQKTRPDFLWSFLAHFGMNMWGDAVRPARRDGMITRQLTDEEFALLDVEKYRRHDHVRFDEDVWQELSAQLPQIPDAYEKRASWRPPPASKPRLWAENCGLWLALGKGV